MSSSQERKGLWRKGVAVLAAAPMLLAMIPTSTAVAADATSDIVQATSDANNVLDLGFDGNLTDTSSVKNTVTAYKGTPSYVDGVDGQAVKLDAGALALGASRKLQPEDLSLSFWWNPTKTMTGEQILMWGKGKYNENGWYLGSNSDSKPLVLSIGVGTPQPLEFNLTGARADIFPANTWTHVMVTFDAATKTATFYINGEAKAATPGNTEQAGKIVADDTTKYIGWNGTHASAGRLTGLLDDVKLWDAVATTADVEREVKVGNPNFDATTLAQAALDKVNIASKATSNLTFNATASNGSTLTYSSDNESVVSNSGVVTRPAIGQPDGTAKITVTASYGSKAVTKDFTVTVPALTDNGGSSDVEYLKNYLSEQGMNNVVVSDEYLQNAGQKEVEYLLSFKPQRLIVEFRANAGLSTKDANGQEIKNYGGWENGPSAARNPDGTSNPNRFTGHFIGHWISAASQAQRSTFATADQKEQLAEKLKEVVTGIREAQEAYAKKDATNAGFFPAFPVNYVPNGGGRLIVPFYNLHKVEAGMVQAYLYGTDDETREAAKAASVDFAKWVVNWKAAHASTNMLATEYGGMNDALYQVAEIANPEDKQTVLTAAHLFDETALFEKLANGQDVLNGLHANTTIPKLTGAMQRYVAYTEDEDLYNSLSKDEQGKLTSLYLKAAKNFFDIVVNDHTYVNGGNSQSEHFHAADALWHDATQNGDQNGGYRNFSTVETCNEYNMLKLARLLFQVTKDAKYSEYYEHTFINAIVASQNPETGMTMYFQPMKAGYPKVFGVTGTDYDKAWFGDAIGEYWCCQGTGIENFAKLNDSFYFTDDNNVYVNMFWSSTYTDARHGLTIKQTANVPKQPDVTFEVSGKGSANLKLRLPDWAIASQVKLTVDGKEQSATAADKDANGWLTVAIKDGTKITYTLPAKLQAIDAADNKNWVAFQYGPVVLAGALTETNYKSNYSYGGIKVRVANYDSDANAKAAVIPTSGTVSDWLKGIKEDASEGSNLVRTDDPNTGNRETLSFKFANVDGDAANLTLQPYYSTYKTTYAIYWDMAEVDSQTYQDNIVKKKSDAAQAALVDDAVDAFDNEFQQELAHNAAKSDDSNAGTYGGKQYRDAQANGWFSYDLAVTQGQNATARRARAVSESDSDVTQGKDNYLSVQYNSVDKGRTFSMIVDPTPVADNSKGEVSANAKTYTVTINDKNGAKAFYWDTQKLPADLVAKAKDGKVRVLFKSTGGVVGGVYGVRVQNATTLSDDASLASLTFDKGTLSPAFSADASEYTLTVPADTTSVDATIGVKNAGAYVKVNGIVIDDTKARTIAFNGVGTKVTITSVAQDHKTTKTYMVNIVQEGADVSQGALEEFDGITTASGDANASVTTEGDLGKVVNVNGGWVGGTTTNGVPTKAVGTFADPSVFNKSSWTLNANVRIASGLNDANADKRSAITIGTVNQNIELLLASGKLGYGANNGGLSAKTAALNSTVTAGKWAKVTVIYTENANSGVVNVSIDGKQVLADTEIGFKLSEQTGTGAYLGHGFNTSFLLDGTYDYVTVSGDSDTPEPTPDKTAPTFAGVEDTTVEFGASFDALAGVTAKDDVDGDLTAAIEVSGTVDTKKAGDYMLTYTVADKAGNKAEATRKVTVKPQPDTVAPVFAGVEDATVEFGADFDPKAGVTAKDDVDGDVTAAIEVSGTVDTKKVGDYTLIYTVADKAGNKAEAKRKVTVKPQPTKPEPSKTLRFTDLVAATPHASDIEWLASAGISTGWKTGETDTEVTAEFRPMNEVIRQDMAAFLYRLAGEPAFDESKVANPFTDVTKSTPHYKEIMWLYSTGISKGFPQADGSYRFGPERAVVRQDMAAFLRRLAKVKDAKPALGRGVSFTDVTAKTPHADDIAWLAQTGVTTGWKNPDGKTAEFRGMNVVVRQDMAAFLHRMSTNVLGK